MLGVASLVLLELKGDEEGSRIRVVTIELLENNVVGGRFVIDSEVKVESARVIVKLDSGLVPVEVSAREEPSDA